MLIKWKKKINETQKQALAVAFDSSQVLMCIKQKI